MKKWTVMLIPQGQGGTRTLTLCELHYWSVFGLIAALAFSSAFFYQRHREMSFRAEALRQANRLLELDNVKIPVEPPTPGVNRDEVRQVEARLRAEYEASIAAITAELSDLYDMETRARDITGLAPRSQPSFDVGAVSGDGKGGGPSRTGPFAYVGEREIMQPPHVIYGMSRPSADLLLEEIRLRTRSLGELVLDMEVQVDRIERMPAGWPLARGVGRITSNFGYRRDPFNRRVRHHDGTDISARQGTPVRATAKGVVRKAEYMNYLGNTVVIDHGNGISTLYAHLSAMSARPGQSVGRGEEIGKVGSTGKSTGSHLHYEVHTSGRPVDPAKYLTD